MSVFTNPAGSAREGAAQYVAAVLDLLGDRNPLEVLAETARLLQDTVSELSEDQLKQPEAAGKWSIRDVLQHLADTELVWGYRVRMTLTQDRPRLVGYDQDLLASRLHYEEADARQALELFAVLRRAHLNLLTTVPASDLQRAAVHAERGDETIEQMIRLSAGHDLLHLNQVARIRANLA